MAKVYVVTSGSYSDYGIERVFSNEDAANSFVKSFNEHDSYNHVGVEVYELLDSDPGMYQHWYKDLLIVGPADGDGAFKRDSSPAANARWENGPVPTSNRPSIEIFQEYVYPDVESWRKEGLVGKMLVHLRGSGPDRELLEAALRERATKVKAQWEIHQARAKEKA